MSLFVFSEGVENRRAVGQEGRMTGACGLWEALVGCMRSGGKVGGACGKVGGRLCAEEGIVEGCEEG